MECEKNIVVMIFDDRMEAERAVRDLETAKFESDQVGFAIRGDDATLGGMVTDAVGTKDGRGAVVGAASGAVIGGVLGAAATLLLPGVGPIIAAGLLSAIAGGAVAGTAVGGILGAMTGLGISQHEAEYYEQQFHAGKAIVAVRAGERLVEAEHILRHHGGYNMQFPCQSPVPTGGVFSKP
jgi:hypothetical protein